MHIGIDATALYGRYGGVEYSLWNLLKALRDVEASGDPQTRNRYTLYIPRDGPPPATTEQFGSQWNWVRLPFSGTSKLRRIAWQQGRLPRQLEEDGCDVLHAPTYVCPLRCRRPVVLTVYDIIALEHPQFATRPNRLHYGALLPRAIQHAREVIVPAEAVRQQIQARITNVAARLHVVPLGVEDKFRREVDASQKARVRARYDLPTEYLLFVGNHEPKKNLQELLRALRLLPQAPPLVVVGGPRAWSGHQPQSSVRLHNCGYIARDDLPALYAMCKAFIFPSLAEGFGLPVLEALACGAPVVTTKAVPLPDLQDVVLLCDATHPGSIAAQIRRVLEDDELCRRLSETGRAYARPFTWQRNAEATLKIYQTALDEGDIIPTQTP